MRRLFNIFKSEKKDEPRKKPEPRDGTVAGGGEFRLDFSSEDFVANPYPFFSRLRDEFPVYRAPTGAYVLSRYEDVAAAFTDKRLGNAPSPYAVVNARNAEKYVCADVASNIIPYMDPPRHNAPRRLVARTFHSHLKNHPPDMPAMVCELVEQNSRNGRLRIVDGVGTPFSVRVMCEFLGLPLKDQEYLKEWTEYFFYLFASMPSEEIRRKVDEALTEFRNYLNDIVEEHEKDPRADFISGLLAAEDGGQKLTRGELIDNCMLLFADGVENVDSGLGNAVRSLLTHPEQWELLVKEPDLLAGAVDECLRYESPAQFVGKVALEDIEWNGVRIPRHSGVLLMVGAANRDPKKFPDPDRLDIKRSAGDHLAFGKGRHSCVGAFLVREEMTAALSVFRKEMKDMRLTDSPVEWVPRLAHRWVREVEVAF